MFSVINIDFCSYRMLCCNFTATHALSLLSAPGTRTLGLNMFCLVSLLMARLKDTDGIQVIDPTLLSSHQHWSLSYEIELIFVVQRGRCLMFL